MTEHLNDRYLNDATEEELRSRLEELEVESASRAHSAMIKRDMDSFNARLDRAGILARRVKAELAVKEHRCACGARKGKRCGKGPAMESTHVGRAMLVSPERVIKQLQKQSPILFSMCVNCDHAMIGHWRGRCHAAGCTCESRTLDEGLAAAGIVRPSPPPDKDEIDTLDPADWVASRNAEADLLHGPARDLAPEPSTTPAKICPNCHEPRATMGLIPGSWACGSCNYRWDDE